MIDLLFDVLYGCGIVLSIAVTVGLIVAFVYLFKAIKDM